MYGKSFIYGTRKIIVKWTRFYFIWDTTSHRNALSQTIKLALVIIHNFDGPKRCLQ